jgi:uncharacterized protein (TIGR04255 family)
MVLGSWPHAPLAFVVAAVNTSKVSTLTKGIAGLQERLADDFPELITGAGQNVMVGPQGLAAENVPFWMFVSEDRATAVVVRSDLIALQTTGYTSWTAFRDQLRSVLTAYAATVHLPMVSRIGLRYIDLIVPRGDESPSQYVAEGIRGAGLPFLKKGRVMVRNQTAHHLPDGGALSVTYSSDLASAGPSSLAFQELAADNLAKSEVMAKAMAHDADVAALDIDRWEQPRFKFDVASIVGKLEEFHDDQRNAIEAIATPFALAVWKGL